MKVCEIVAGVSELHKVRVYAIVCMPFFVHAGVPQISEVPVTTQDEDKSGKALHSKKTFS